MAHFVYMVLIKRRTQTQLLFEAEGGLWTLAGGEVAPGEDERDALLRHVQDQWKPASEVEILSQLGPLYISNEEACTAKAFCCHVEDPTGEACGPFAQCQFFNRDDLLTSVFVERGIIERIIWDAFSLFEEPVKVPNPTTPFGVDDIYSEPGKEHLLLQEEGDHLLIWRRLDPRGQNVANATS